MAASIKRHMEMQEKKIADRIEKYQFSTSTAHAKYVRMEQGKLKKSRDRLESRLAEIMLKRDPEVRHDLVSAGVIMVY